MLSGSLRTRLALLYAGVFLALAVVVLAIPYLSVSETVHVCEAGMGSVFPAESVARTWNVC